MLHPLEGWVGGGGIKAGPLGACPAIHQVIVRQKQPKYMSSVKMEHVAGFVRHLCLHMSMRKHGSRK
jgi:hypothetical protein